MAGVFCRHQYHDPKRKIQSRQRNDVADRYRSIGIFAHAGRALLPLIGLNGILILDVTTFFLAIAALLMVAIPKPTLTVEGQEGKGSLLKEASFGFKYIFARRGLLSLLMYFLTLNFVSGFAWPVVAPFILSRTANSSTALGAAQSAWAIGGVVGGVLMSLWGGYKRKMKNILIGEALTGFFGMILFGLANSLWMWMATAAVGAVFFPLVNGSSQAIWQAKVAPDVQGRVFAVRRMIAWFMDPITPIIAGLMADFVTEPGMQSSTWLGRTFGGWVGNTPGSGMALQFIFAGIAYIVITLGVTLFVPALRNLEDQLPDHDQMKTLEPAPVE